MNNCDYKGVQWNYIIVDVTIHLAFFQMPGICNENKSM